MKPQRIEVLGVPVDCLTRAQALACIKGFMKGERPEAVIAVNPEKVMKAQHDGALRGQLARAGLLIPDGIGVVLAAQAQSAGTIERVAGSDLMPVICEMAQRHHYKIFLFGGRQDVNLLATQNLQRRYPGISIVGSEHGYLSDQEMPGLIHRINQSRAEILFVALGSPKQERWMDQYLPQLTVKVCQGVGGTFDILAGRVKRAPLLIQKMRLEWLYRLARDPRRVIRQFVLPRYAYLVLKKMVLGVT